MSAMGGSLILMTGNQSESIQPTQYFVQCEVDGSCYAFYRKRYEANGLFEECWQVEAKKWVYIPGRIIWMQISGECTLAQVSFLEIQQLIPDAFKGEVNYVPKS
jgi:hypothetical protein